MHGCASRTPSAGDPSLHVTSVPVPCPGSLTDYMALHRCRDVSAARKQRLPFHTLLVSPLLKRFTVCTKACAAVSLRRGDRMFTRSPTGYLRMRFFLFIQNYPIKQSYHCLLSGTVSSITALLKKGATRLQFAGKKTERMNIWMCTQTWNMRNLKCKANSSATAPNLVGETIIDQTKRMTTSCVPLIIKSRLDEKVMF